MFRKIGKESGIVLITVVIIIAVMMILVVSIISMNVSQSVVSKEETKKLKCEILSEGILNSFLSEYANKGLPATSPSPCPSGFDYCKAYTVTMDNLTYNIMVQKQAPPAVGSPCVGASAIDGTCPLSVTCDAN
ncbi:MAG: hypothetical protein HQL25_05035 [Candidatus Omnitrophica bacterium]|nr:hypothetical protein [Candidatus Omnitrophota bacterium]